MTKFDNTSNVDYTRILTTLPHIVPYRISNWSEIAFKLSLS